MYINLMVNPKCLCGSGEEYKKCCMDILSKSLNKFDINKEMQMKNFSLAFQYAKAALTQYIDSIKHENSIDRKMESSNNIFLSENIADNDIKSMERIIYELMQIIKDGDLQVDFSIYLDNLYNTFYNSKWHKRIIHYKLLWTLVYMNDRKGAEDIIDNVKYPINDIDYLQLVLEVKHEKYPFSKNKELIIQIINQSENLTTKIQYYSALAVEYFLIEDREQVKKIVKDVKSMIAGNIDDLEMYDAFQIGNVFYFSGIINEDMEDFKNSIPYYLKIVNHDNATDEGLAYAYIRLGYTYLALGDNYKALECFGKSGNSMYDAFGKISIAKTHNNLEEYNKAKDLLGEVIFEELNDEYKISYFVVAVHIAINNKDNNEVLKVAVLLKNFKPVNKYYENIKNSLLVDLQNILIESNFKDENKKVGLLEKINRYLLLQPNFFGFGINLNNIVNDYIDKKKK